MPSKYRRNLIYIGVFLFALIAFLGFLEHLDHTTDYQYSRVHASSGELFVSLYYPENEGGEVAIGRLTHGKESHTTNMPWGKKSDEPNKDALPRIHFNQDVSFNGEPLSEGVYYLYLVPRKLEMVIYVYQHLETEDGKETDFKGNITQTQVPLQLLEESQENPDFTLISENNSTVSFAILLDQYKVEIPITAVN